MGRLLFAYFFKKILFFLIYIPKFKWPIVCVREGNKAK